MTSHPSSENYLPGEKELNRGSAPGSEVVRDSSETLGSHYSGGSNFYDQNLRFFLPYL